MSRSAPQQLAALNDLPDYRVTAEDIDPRGWTIIDADGAVLGTVADLIIDQGALTARYIVCSLSQSRGQVLVPTGFVRLDDENRVRLDFVTAADIEKLPQFTGLPFSDAYAARMEEALTGVTPSAEPAKIVRRSS